MYNNQLGLKQQDKTKDGIIVMAGEEELLKSRSRNSLDHKCADGEKFSYVRKQ